MASTFNNPSFKAVSYNMHGKNQGIPTFEFITVSMEPDVIFLQEHWQTLSTLDSILNFSLSYQGFGISAMATVIGKSILRGRPFAGTAILVNNEFRNIINVLLISE